MSMKIERIGAMPAAKRFSGAVEKSEGGYTLKWDLDETWPESRYRYSRAGITVPAATGGAIEAFIKARSEAEEGAGKEIRSPGQAHPADIEKATSLCGESRQRWEVWALWRALEEIFKVPYGAKLPGGPEDLPDWVWA